MLCIIWSWQNFCVMFEVLNLKKSGINNRIKKVRKVEGRKGSYKAYWEQEKSYFALREIQVRCYEITFLKVTEVGGLI